MWERNLARVDLTEGTVTVERIPAELRRRFVGARGLNVYYLHKYAPPGVEPFAPENPIIFGAGMLTGTMAPSASRMNVTFKSPESYALGDGNIGGFFGAEMRNAGFDHVIVTGAAERPSYLWIEDGKVEIRDAGSYWGMETIALQDKIRKDHGNSEMVVTGVAGENRVRYAAVRSGYKRSARCGGGAVMGAKNLKALVARGTHELPVVDPAKALEVSVGIHNHVGSSKVAKVLGTVGTAFLYDTSNALGAIRTKNSQGNFWVDDLDSHHIEHYIDKMVACSSCSVHCTHRNSLGGEGPEYSTTGILGANIGITKTAELIELNNVANDLGFDTSSLGTILAWHMELYQRGIITDEETGAPLEWAETPETFEAVKEWIRKIAHREGWGDVMAEGTRATKMGLLPKEADDYVIAIKGLPQSDPHDVRYLKAFSIGIATASRGADHLRSRPTLEIFMNLPMDLKEKIYGKGATRDPTVYEGKAQTVYHSERIYSLGDACGICRFVTHGFNSPHLTEPHHMRDLLEATTGLKLTMDELWEVAENMADMERLYNLREGLSRKDDTLPKRYFDDPMPSKVTKGHHISREKFEMMLDEYYALHKWEKDGTLPEARRRQLAEWLKIENEPVAKPTPVAR